MKKLIIVSAIAAAFMLSACGNSSTEQKSKANVALDTTKLKSGDPYYQCEMDPDVISDKPGSCSKCSMDLVKKQKK